MPRLAPEMNIVLPLRLMTAEYITSGRDSFSPATVSIKKGGKVTWKWTQGGVPHNVTPASGAAGSATCSKKGFTFMKTFSKAGTFKYICTIHSNMKMTVKVS